MRTTQKQTWGEELARMSGGELVKGLSVLKKNLSERVKFFEVLIFSYFFQDLGMGTTQKQTWGDLASSVGGGGHGLFFLERVIFSRFSFLFIFGYIELQWSYKAHFGGK